MIDRTYVEKAADAGAGKVSLLQLDPCRYLLRSVGAGIVLTVVGFAFWVLTQNLNDISLGRVIAAGFFGVGLTIIVFTNTELFTSGADQAHFTGAYALVDPRLEALDAAVRLPRNADEARTNVRYFDALDYRVYVAGATSTKAAESTGVDATEVDGVDGAVIAAR